MPGTRETKALLLVLVLATAVAVASARPYAGSWNDGSRLATVECLVDRHTLVIDDSLFVAVPDDGTRNPYRGEALEKGTLDKLYIDGHFYSDKSPVPALLLAVIYQALQWLFGLQVRLHPEAFCWCMTVLSSGVAYVVAAVCMFRVGRVVGLPLNWRLALTASFGLATIAVVYVQHVNNHILLLGGAAALMLQGAQLAESTTWRRVLLLGCLAGLGYTIDLGAGPPLLVCTGLLIVWTCPRRLAAGGFFVVGALPWLALHHVVNYAVGGTLGPANAVPEYFNWEGCPFHGAALTGTWHHQSHADFAVYALALLFGKRGFVGHDPALFLLLLAMLHLVPRLRLGTQCPRGSASQHHGYQAEPGEQCVPRQSLGTRIKKPALLLAGAWCCGTWLIYAVTSRNYSGACCSIRWFVPLLAPIYYALAVILAQRPRWRADFLLLSAWGTVLMSLAWLQGPWNGHMVPGFWPILGAALLCWTWLAWRRNRQKFLLIEREMQSCHPDEPAQNQAA